MTNSELIERASAIVKPKRVGAYLFGDVGCALLAESGAVYLGVCIDTSCGTGFCAEHSAIAAMITAGEYRIKKIVAVASEDGETVVLSPCGRCREFMRQVDEANLAAEVVLDLGQTKSLAELLPYHDWWQRLSDS